MDDRVKEDNSLSPLSIETLLDLPTDEQDTLIKQAARIHGRLLNRESSLPGYYFFGMGRFSFEIPEGSKYLKKVCLDPTAKLTPEQEQAVYDYEQDEFKIHINLPEELKISLFSKILKVKKQYSEIVEQIFNEKELRDEEQFASGDEIRQKGGELTRLHRWKMKKFYGPGSKNPQNADFVIYVTKEKGGESMIEALMEAVREIAPLVRSLNIPEDQKPPRYSLPVIIDGEEVNGLSVCQGNGDFKNYLRRTGEDEKLARFYDPETNFALRKGVEIKF